MNFRKPREKNSSGPFNPHVYLSVQHQLLFLTSSADMQCPDLATAVHDGAIQQGTRKTLKEAEIKLGRVTLLLKWMAMKILKAVLLCLVGM